MNTIVQKRQTHMKWLERVHTMLCDLHFRVPIVHEALPDFASMRRVAEPALTCDPLTEQQIAECPYGLAFGQRFAAWISNLKRGQRTSVALWKFTFATRWAHGP